MQSEWVVSTAEHQGSKRSGCETSRTHPDGPRRPPSLLYKWYGVSLLGVKQWGRDVNHPNLHRAEVIERVDLCLHLPSCAFLGCYSL